jgi:hypothetical protein
VQFGVKSRLQPEQGIKEKWRTDRVEQRPLFDLRMARSFEGAPESCKASRQRGKRDVLRLLESASDDDKYGRMIDSLAPAVQ